MQQRDAELHTQFVVVPPGDEATTNHWQLGNRRRVWLQRSSSVCSRAAHYCHHRRFVRQPMPTVDRYHTVAIPVDLQREANRYGVWPDNTPIRPFCSCATGLYDFLTKILLLCMVRFSVRTLAEPAPDHYQTEPMVRFTVLLTGRTEPMVRFSVL